MSCENSGDCSTGIRLESTLALRQIQCTIKRRGMAVYLKLDEAETVERDDFGSIKKRNSPIKTIYAMPVSFSPTSKEKSRSGIKDSCQAMITTSMKDWIDLGFSDKDLSHIDTIKATIILRGQTYEIKDKNMQDQIGDTFLYVVLGLNRK